MSELQKLKAEAYDCIAQMEAAKVRLQQINQEILKLQQSSPPQAE